MWVYLKTRYPIPSIGPLVKTIMFRKMPKLIGRKNKHASMFIHFPCPEVTTGWLDWSGSPCPSWRMRRKWIPSLLRRKVMKRKTSPGCRSRSRGGEVHWSGRCATSCASHSRSLFRSVIWCCFHPLNRHFNSKLEKLSQHCTECQEMWGKYGKIGWQQTVFKVRPLEKARCFPWQLGSGGGLL